MYMHVLKTLKIAIYSTSIQKALRTEYTAACRQGNQNGGQQNAALHFKSTHTINYTEHAWKVIHLN